MPCILALDQGTSSSRAILFDERGRRLGAAQKELAQHFPEPGWVEHDPEEIWSTTLGTARQALKDAGVAAGDVAAIGITNQRETIVLRTGSRESRSTTQSSGRIGARPA